MKNNYFLLFANCIPVAGYKNYIICDLYLNRYLKIPKFIYFVFTELKGKSVIDTKKYFNNEVNQEFEEFINLLEREGWGFYTNDKNSFPEISLDYSIPFEFSNAIFDFDNDSKYNLVSAIHKIDKLGCNAIQIRFFKPVEFSFLKTLLEGINNISISYIEIILNNIDCSIDCLKKVFEINLRLKKIFLYGMLTNEVIHVENDYIDYGYLYITKVDLLNETGCGSINKENFISDLTVFSESKQFNNCLNKKISVDKHGLVKNCPSMKNNFGKIENLNSLNSKLFSEFKLLWEINKDKVEICKDCEFRYICIDCRAFLEKPEDIFSKPLKCNYDPYIGGWKSN